MDTQNEKPKRKYLKFFIAFLAMILLVIGGWRILPLLYQKWGEMRVERLAENLRKLEEEGYKAAMADTYGGKTPQETLQMYIEAVEKGDYELASKYFVIGNQEQELANLRKNNNIDALLGYLRQLQGAEGYYARDDRDIYIMEEPFYVEFMLYPNGVWKIIRI